MPPVVRSCRARALDSRSVISEFERREPRLAPALSAAFKLRRLRSSREVADHHDAQTVWALPRRQNHLSFEKLKSLGAVK